MKNRKSNIVMGFVIFIAGLMILMGCGSSSPITRSYEKVSEEYPGAWEWCDLADDGSYLTIDTNPYDEDAYMSLDAYDMIMDINKELGFPESIGMRMGKTRSMDGIQNYDGEKVRAQWTYHPNDGLEVMYELKGK